ncbi:hypothetical protein BACI9J_60398 [Bacillus altitudinis]|nr:hypothetical protein BACI9J_60398 [Bacillus altitudinis]
MNLTLIHLIIRYQHYLKDVGRTVTMFIGGDTTYTLIAMKPDLYISLSKLEGALLVESQPFLDLYPFLLLN